MMAVDFKNIFSGKVVIVGIGNILKGDDGLGPALIERLRDKVPCVCIDAAIAPESYLGKIIKESPDTILLVDAVHLGRRPGEYQILDKREIVNSALTTHDISPRMLIEYLEHQTTAGIYLLGIQPKSIKLGDGMSFEVSQTLAEIERMIVCTKPT